MFVLGAAEEGCVDSEHKIFRCFVLVDETRKGDMNSPAHQLIFMRWRPVLAGDISLRIREAAEGRAVGGD